MVFSEIKNKKGRRSIMLESDEIIYNYLIEEKKNGNELLKHFHIKYP